MSYTIGGKLHSDPLSALTTVCPFSESPSQAVPSELLVCPESVTPFPLEHHFRDASQPAFLSHLFCRAPAFGISPVPGMWRVARKTVPLCRLGLPKPHRLQLCWALVLPPHPWLRAQSIFPSAFAKLSLSHSCSTLPGTPAPLGLPSQFPEKTGGPTVGLRVCLSRLCSCRLGRCVFILPPPEVLTHSSAQPPSYRTLSSQWMTVPPALLGTDFIMACILTSDTHLAYFCIHRIEQILF